MDERDLFLLKEQIISFMDSALSVIDSLREENIQLKMQETHSVEQETSLIKVENPRGICKCGRMELRKCEVKCDLCLGFSMRKLRSEIQKRVRRRQGKPTRIYKINE